jgi:hypothetical protein
MKVSTGPMKETCVTRLQTTYLRRSVVFHYTAQDTRRNVCKLLRLSPESTATLGQERLRATNNFLKGG